MADKKSKKKDEKKEKKGKKKDKKKKKKQDDDSVENSSEEPLPDRNDRGTSAEALGSDQPIGKIVASSVPPKEKKLKKKVYEKELRRLQVELVKLQEWVKTQKLKVVVIFEGRDAAGKGGVIKRITQCLNPRTARVVALGVPTEREKSQWYFQRYAPHLPAAGEIVLFDRSWYNRAGVERVMGFCTEEEYWEFMRSCPEFERMLVRSGIILIKYWFSVSD